MKALRTDSTNIQFIELVKLLDEELALRDGDDHDFYHQFNSIDALKHVVVIANENGTAVACGAFKPFDEKSVEIKRMYTLEDQRGKGIASLVLQELEDWAQEIGFEKTVLETGQKQPEAIQLYKKRGYIQTPNFGQYQGIENSLCFERKLVK